MKQQKVKSSRPAPPEDIEGEALLEWERVCVELEAAGRLDVTDRAILVVYVECWADHRAACRAVAEHGAVIKYSSNPGVSPFWKVKKDAAAQLRKLLADLGLTPQARGKSMGPAEDDELSEF